MKKQRFALATAVLFIALLPRILGSDAPVPFDDFYHLKRIAWSAAHFPRVLAFDTDRGFHGAWCPWPPLYDAALGGVARLFGMESVSWLPPIGTSLFAAALASLIAARFGLLGGAVTGLLVALHSYLIPVSSHGAVDHHWVEPMFVMLILGLTAAPRSRTDGLLLGLAITAALFVQTALIVAAALAFLALFFVRDDARRGAIAFGIAASAVALHRLVQPAGYPDNPWFLGWPHVAVLAAAAIACIARTFGAQRLIALATGALCLAPVLPSVIAGARFFGGDPWLETITEFQPMFHDSASVGTDLANLTGGALLVFTIARRHRTLALFTLAYLALALSSHRFLVPAVPLFAVAAGVAVAHRSRQEAAGGLLVVTLLALAPTLAYDAYALRQPQDPEDETRAVAQRLASMPPGRVLAPWSYGHAIDVVGKHAVVLDNFGSMADPAVFEEGSRALLATSDRELVRWCHAHGVRYVVFGPVARIGATAASIGVDVEARSTVWWRTLRPGDRFQIVVIE